MNDEYTGPERRSPGRREADHELADAIHELRDQRRWMERTAPWALGLGLLLMIVAIVISVSSLRSLADRRTVDEGSCKVVNSVTREANRTNGLIYLLLRTAKASAERQSDRLEPGAIERARAYETFAKGVNYLPPLDCDEAVAHPDSYKIPPPVRYGDYLRQGGAPPVILPPVGG